MGGGGVERSDATVPPKERAPIWDDGPQEVPCGQAFAWPLPSFEFRPNRLSPPHPTPPATVATACMATGTAVAVRLQPGRMAKP